MKKYRIIISTVFLVLAMGTLASQFARGPSTDAEREFDRRAKMVGLVRTINTAEAVEHRNYGSYGSWQTLLIHNQEYLNEWLARIYDSRAAKAHFGDLAEILPGWKLRLHVNPDGQAYVVLLEEVNDNTGFAALSDERGVIRECKYLH